LPDPLPVPSSNALSASSCCRIQPADLVRRVGLIGLISLVGLISLMGLIDPVG